jgi:hypothetical protein
MRRGETSPVPLESQDSCLPVFSLRAESTAAPTDKSGARHKDRFASEMFWVLFS